MNFRLASYVAIAGLVLAGLASQAQARVDVEAIPAQPFGVGRITLSGPDVAIDATRVLIYEKNNRVHYPAVTTGVFGRLIGQVLGDPTQQPATAVNIHFLFDGSEPLEITVFSPQSVPVTVEPRAPAGRRADRELNRMFTAWWREYNAQARQLREAGNHPPLVQNYLLTMLAQRMNLEPPLIERLQPDEQPAEMTKSIEMLLGIERLRDEILRSTMQGRGDFGQAADSPLPPEPVWTELPLPEGAPRPEIEPIALRVPPECFYIRFGRFPNYLWLNKLQEEYGGDISTMITLRSYLAPLNKRVQNQLGLEQNLLAELLGEHVIADVALIGRDTFVKDGAAAGILFQAKATDVLKNDLSQQRSRAFAREKDHGATSEKVTIAGHEVSYVSTPDNRLRSFYAIDGDYHLVTTSRVIVERFLEIGDARKDGADEAGRPLSLGETLEFQYAREEMPLSRNDTVFVYFSSRFFQGLLSPQYQVELERRLKSTTDMELLQLARLAARGEGLTDDRIDELTRAGLLPRGFGRRPDGSGPILTEDGMLDSRRGIRGNFTPIPDVKIAGITRGEQARIDAVNATLSRDWRRMDPLMIGVQRTKLDDNATGEAGRERIVVDANVSPLDETKYGWLLSILGPPTTQMVTPAAGDVVHLQASVRGGVLSPNVPPHYLFAGLQDIAPLVTIQPTGILQWYNLLRATPGYIGSVPTAGFLDLLPFNLGGSQPDENGFSRLPFGLWRRQGAGFSVVSFDPQLLANVTPQLRVVEAQTEAQVRLHVGDLNDAKVRPWINGMYYQRAISASAGNVRFMHQLNQQLHVPMAQTREAAEDILDATLVCPLGGKYELLEELGGAQIWESTAWAKRDLANIPEDFEAPLLKWFRGADAHLLKTEDRIFTHAELDIQRKPGEAKAEIPSFFDLFKGGGQKALKPKEKPGEPTDAELPAPLPPVKNPPKADSLREPVIEVPATRER